MAMNYSAKVMDHFSNPRNVGEIENPSAVGEVGNAVCGDIMKIYLKIENNIITDVKFRTFGCGAAIATSSMATELIKANRSTRLSRSPIRRSSRRSTGFLPQKSTAPSSPKKRLRRLSTITIKETASISRWRFTA